MGQLHEGGAVNMWKRENTHSTGGRGARWRLQKRYNAAESAKRVGGKKGYTPEEETSHGAKMGAQEKGTRKKLVRWHGSPFVLYAQYPCKECGRREIGCHSDCQQYADAKERQDAMRARDQKESIFLPAGGMKTRWW